MSVDIPAMQYATVVDGKFQVNTARSRACAFIEGGDTSTLIRRFYVAADEDNYFGHARHCVRATRVLLYDESRGEKTWRRWMSIASRDRLIGNIRICSD